MLMMPVMSYDGMDGWTEMEFSRSDHYLICHYSVEAWQLGLLVHEHLHYLSVD